MTRTDVAPAAGVDLTSCDREPIHAPGSIQPHGLLLVLEGDALRVRRASRNVEDFLGRPVEDLLGRPLDEILGPDMVGRLRPGLDACPAGAPARVVGVIGPGGSRGESYTALAHRLAGDLVLELEAAGPLDAGALHEVYPNLQAFLSGLDSAATPEALMRLAAGEVRAATGFDRVLVYRFDDDGHGTVVAEDRNDRLPSYLGQRFPASDIPKQARELYRANRVRIIPDAGYTPVPIAPEADPPSDLSQAVLRSVSPVHVRYMQNMGTAASMSISLVRGDTLWGLISCHHREPRLVPYAVRASCEFLGRVLSAQLANAEHQRASEHQLRLGETRARLVASLTAREDLAAGLAEHAGDLLSFARAVGVAILYEGRCVLLGETPGESEVRRIAGWLAREVRREVFATDTLADRLPRAVADPGRASGLLAVSISKLHDNYLMWFRPELPRTVVWAGDPRKPAGPSGEPGGHAALTPRASFEAWREFVRGRSAPWDEAEVAAAVELRNAIVGVVLRAAEELAQLNAELRRSNGELEAFSYSVSHDLRAPLRHIVGYAELLRDAEGDRLGDAARRYLGTILESANYAGTLVDNLLAFSRMGRTTIHPMDVDTNVLVREVIADVTRDAAGRSVTWEVRDLPPARGDLMMLRLAWANLLSNAVKYTRPRPEAVIRVWGEDRNGECVYHVKDNGIGFDMRYADKLFGVFQRLHRMEDFEGTGIGLANVRRIVSRHGGQAWAEGEVGVGATVSFSLPMSGPPAKG